MRRSWTRLALATAALLALAGLAMPALTSQAEPPCDLAAKVDAALAVSTAGPDQATVVELPVACQINQEAQLEPYEDGLPYVTWVKLTGQRILRDPSYKGAMIRLGAGFGLILDNIEINGSGQGGAELAPSAVIVNVQRGAELVLDDGARLVENRSRAVSNNGRVTLRGSTAVIANNRLTIHPDEPVPGGAGLVNSPAGVLTMMAGAIRDNTVASTGQVSGGPNQTPPSVIGAGLLNLGQATISGGAISGNGFDLEGAARSYGGGLATAFDSASSQTGQVTFAGNATEPVVLRGNSATHGGAIALLGNGSANRSTISLTNVAIESNQATTSAGAIYVADGVLSLADGAVIGSVANTIASGGTGAGVVNASGEVRLSGSVRFANGNGLTATSQDRAPLVTGALTGGTGSLPLESIPYFSQVGSNGQVVVARAGGNLAQLQASDLAAFSQTNELLQLVLAPGSGGNANGVVEARWRAFAINYHGLQAGETGPEPRVFYGYSPDITLVPGPSRPGQRFIAWTDSEALTTVVTMIPAGTDHDVDLWADYRSTARITYVASQSHVTQLPVDASEYLPGETAQVLPPTAATAPVRPGYTFLSWRSSQGATYRPGESLTVPPEGAVLTAQWEPIQYRIDYNGAAGSNPTSFTVESDTIVLVDPPIVSGYVFAGWFTAASGGGQQVTQIPAGTIGSVSLWPHYLPDSGTQPTTTPTQTASPSRSATPSQSPSPSRSATASSTPRPTTTPPPSARPTPSWPTPVLTPKGETTSKAATTNPSGTQTGTQTATTKVNLTATPQPSTSASPRRSWSISSSPSYSPTRSSSPTPSTSGTADGVDWSDLSDDPTTLELDPAEPSTRDLSVSPEASAASPSSATSSSPSTVAGSAADGPTEPPAASQGIDTRQVTGWTLVASGTVGLAAMGTYWIRRLRRPRGR